MAAAPPPIYLSKFFPNIISNFGTTETPISDKKEVFGEPAPAPITCFRIRGISAEWTTDELCRELATIDPELRQASDISLLPSCCDHLTRVALLRLDYSTKYFGSFTRNEERFEKTSKRRPTYAQKNGKIGQKYEHIVIDKHFYDLTQLNDPQKEICADIIAITGLAGHAFGSWRSRTSRAMWLHDFLPQDIDNVRVLTYGYDSSLREPNNASLLNYRRNFIEQLHNARRDCKNRPIILIGHSLGGILVLQTLLECTTEDGNNKIGNAIEGIFLFGTPCHGPSDIADLNVLVDPEGDGANQKHMILEQLKETSEFLEEQQEALQEVLKKFQGKIVTFYETEMTRTPRQTMENVFERTGEYAQMVEKLSAQLEIQNEELIPITENHTNMVKFKSDQDGVYRTFLKHFKDCIGLRTRRHRGALQYIISGWNDDTSLQLKYHWGLLFDGRSSIHTRNEYTPHDTRKYCWFLRNKDYTDWKYGQTAKFSTLGIGGQSMEDMTAEVMNDVSELTHTEGLGLLIFRFVYTDAFQAGGNLVVELLSQLAADQPSISNEILQAFFEKILGSISDAELATIGPDKFEKQAVALISLLAAVSSEDDAWNAFFVALDVNCAEYKRSHGVSSSSDTAHKRSLVLLLDLQSLESCNPAIILNRMKSRGKKSFFENFINFKILFANYPEYRPENTLGNLDFFIEHDKERKECLKSLSYTNSRYENISTRSKNTFTWLWQDEEYCAWKASTSSKLLLVEGKPGSGKSTLTRYFKETFNEEDFKSRASAENNNQFVVADYFYSRRNELIERNHANMLRSLLHHILSQDETFFIHFQEEYRRLKKKPDKELKTWSYESLKMVLRSCKNHPWRTTLFLIIDALDESDEEDRRDIVKLFRFLCSDREPPVNEHKTPGLYTGESRCVVKIFLASRPIKETLDQYQNRPQHHLICMEDRNLPDITNFADVFLCELDLDTDTRQRVREYLLLHAKGGFLWVQLVRNGLTRFVDDGPSKAQLMKFVQSLPRELEGYYELMLQSLDKNNEIDIAHGERMLQLCMFGDRTINIDELQHAMVILDDFDPVATAHHGDFDDLLAVNTRKRIIHCVNDFFEIKKIHINPILQQVEIVQIMHQTVREFFQRPHPAVQSSIFSRSIDFEAAELRIFQMCVQYLTLVHGELRIGLAGYSEPTLEAFRFITHHLNKRPFFTYARQHYLNKLFPADKKIPAWTKSLEPIKSITRPLDMNIAADSESPFYLFFYSWLLPILPPNPSYTPQYWIHIGCIAAAENCRRALETALAVVRYEDCVVVAALTANMPALEYFLRGNRSPGEESFWRDPNYVDSQHRFPLLSVCSDKDFDDFFWPAPVTEAQRLAVVKCLVDCGVRVNATIPTRNALMTAAASGFGSIVKYFVESTNSHSFGGALILAAQRGHGDIVDYLLPNGIRDVDLDRARMTASKFPEIRAKIAEFQNERKHGKEKANGVATKREYTETGKKAFPTYKEAQREMETDAGVFMADDA